MYDTLAGAGLAPEGFDLSAAFGHTDLPLPGDLRALGPANGGSLVVHINGPYLPYALSSIGRALLKHRRIIGYWAWELPSLPSTWSTGIGFAHEIWVPSRFVRDAVSKLSKLPVHVVPHALAASHASSLQRSDFGLPERVLLILNIFNFGSNISRKNPLAAVAAFKKAFGDSERHVLVLKVVDRGIAPAERRRLNDAIAGASNIRIIDRVMSRQEVADLIATAEIVISMHRSEGFGLVLAEAMRLGKPVIATAWSGNTDFMTEHNSAPVSYRLVPASDPQETYNFSDQLWAEPDVDHAASWLRQLAENSDMRERMGKAASFDIVARLAPQKVAQIISKRLARSSQIVRSIANNDQLPG
jgi:glycosyltransferase involved in cell wall biosynthesis